MIPGACKASCGWKIKPSQMACTRNIGLAPLVLSLSGRSRFLYAGRKRFISVILPDFPPHRISGRFIPIYNIGLQSVIQYENEEHHFHLYAFLFDTC